MVSIQINPVQDGSVFTEGLWTVIYHTGLEWAGRYGFSQLGWRLSEND